MFNSHKILVNHYAKQIESDFNWDQIKQEVLTNCRVDEDQIVGSVFLGTVFGLTPSGKVYAFWTTNQTRSDVRRDGAFNEALENVADKHGLFVDYFDDGIFVCKLVEFSDVKGYTTEDDAELAKELNQ